jgi:hypothetical protein
MNPTPPGMPREEVKRQMRAHHRQAIQDAYDEATLCREQYDEQRARGEIDDELYRDMSQAAYGLYMQLRPAVMDTDFEDEVNEARDVFDEVFAADTPLCEMESVTPKTFAAIIDRLTAIAVRGGLAEVEA